MQTEMGKIAGLLNDHTMQKTPLQVRLNQLGKRISVIALAAAAFSLLIGELQGEPLLEMFMTSISLAVAAVPETLTVIVTLTLAYGVQKMAKNMRLFVSCRLLKRSVPRMSSVRIKPVH